MTKNSTSINNGIKDPVNHKLTASEMKMDKFGEFLNELTDVPSSVPLRPYTINKAGIANQSAYIKVRSFSSDGFVPIFCNISMQVELEGHRGIHMSRCEEALFYLADQEHESLDSFAEQLAKELQERQDASISYVSVEGHYLLERSTIKSNRISHDKMTLTASVKRNKNKTDTRIGVAAYNITACPCTETFTKFSVVPKLTEAGFSLKQIQNILEITNSGTHTQRGIATIITDKTTQEVTHKALYNVLDKSCHLIFELLKRPDEHDLVVRALRKPQFTEDVVREIAANYIKQLSDYMHNNSYFFTSSLLFDSIHIHDVYTEIEKNFSQLKDEQ